MPDVAGFVVSAVLAVVTEGRAIIRRHRSKEFCRLLILSCLQPGQRIRTRPPLNQEEQ